MCCIVVFALGVVSGLSVGLVTGSVVLVTGSVVLVLFSVWLLLVDWAGTAVLGAPVVLLLVSITFDVVLFVLLFDVTFASIYRKKRKQAPR